MKFIHPSDWSPRGIAGLEPAAMVALRNATSTAVVAGPGAGKTEFLAQRAAYLLETGICPPPYRILAISFKSDAAKNLADRVRARCPTELSSRFQSMTFDAFTKGLVDRFLLAIPQPWQPRQPYTITQFTRGQIEAFLDRSYHAAQEDWKREVVGLPRALFESVTVGAWRLPIHAEKPQSGHDFVLYRWWVSQLKSQPSPLLTFTSLNRLAELLLRSNDQIRKAIRLTYPFVFVDEFQDTTFGQYDFLLSAFSGENSAVVTAVGDNKQRIMAWAGARQDAFSRFASDFHATQISLTFNFRSSAGLVAIQGAIARALDPNATTVQSRAAQQISQDVAQVWHSVRRSDEATFLAKWIASSMQNRSKLPRDYALLVKQRANDYEEELEGAFAAHGLAIRNESKAIGKIALQDLLADDVCVILLSLLRLVVESRNPEAWRLVTDALHAVREIEFDDEVGAMKVERELGSFISELSALLTRCPPEDATAVDVAEKLFAFVGENAIRRTYQRYAAGDLLSIVVEAFTRHLQDCAAKSSTWLACVDEFAGTDQIPLMTVHKSKGLEFDTVIFVGLDDSAWWSYSPGDEEGMAVFFVALSRAKQQAIFLFCEARGPREKIADLFQLLQVAGVREFQIPSQT